MLMGHLGSRGILIPRHRVREALSQVDPQGVATRWCKAIWSNLGMTVAALVERTISTSGYLEYLSTATNKYSPEGRGP